MDPFRKLFAVALVFALMAGALWWLRRKNLLRFSRLPRRDRRTRVLEIVERVQLGPQHSVQLLRIDGRTLAIGVHPYGMTLLDGGDGARWMGLAGVPERDSLPVGGLH